MTSQSAKKPAGKTQAAVKKSVSARKTKAPAATGAAAGIAFDAILSAVRMRVPKAAFAEAQAFVGEFYRRMAEDEFPQHTPEVWAALALDLLEFARRRKPGTASVRVFNPTAKANGWESACEDGK